MAYRQVPQVICLFPFLTVDPRSRKQRILRMAARAPHIIGWLAATMGMMPSTLQQALVRKAMPGLAPHALETTLGLFHRRVALNAFFLARHEFADLAQPADWSLLERLGAPH